MNDKQRVKMTMIRSVVGVKENNTVTINAYSMLQQSFDVLVKKFNEIRDVDVTRSADIKGTTEDKHQAKENLALLTEELAAADAAYANDENNLELERVFQVSYTDIRYASDEEAAALAEVVLEELIKIDATILESYMISVDDTTELKSSIRSFDGMAQHKGSQKSSRVAATKKLSTLFSEADQALEKLDRLMKRLQRKHPDFFNTYTNARVLIG